MPERTRNRSPQSAAKPSEADRAEAGKNATPQEGGTEAARQEKAAARDTPEVQAASTTGSTETPQRVEDIQAQQGLGGTGDTGEPRTAAQRDEAATASAYRGSNLRETPDTEVAMRAQDDTREVVQQPETHYQEAQAYFSSALIDAYRTARAAVTSLRSLSTPAESTAFQPPETFIPAIEALEQGLENFRVAANIQG